jgi:hypothetical protein
MFLGGQMKRRIPVVVGVLLFVSLLAAYAGHATSANARFEISYSAALDNGPVTGRVFVMISKNNLTEPRLQAGSYNASVPFFGLDVNALKPGENAVVDTSALGYPVDNVNQLPHSRSLRTRRTFRIHNSGAEHS